MKQLLPMALCLVLAGGCATEHIRVYPPLSPTQSMELIDRRAARIHTVSTRADITLTRPSGDSIRLDAAMALQLPQFARLEAWKFGQAIFDLTLTPDGLWLIAPQQGDLRDKTRAAGANTAQLLRQWIALMSGSPGAQSPSVETRGDDLLLTTARKDGMTLRCRVDRKTLAPRQYTLADQSGTVRFTLSLDHYAQFGDVIWPRRIRAVSDSGAILIEMFDVEINGAIPAGAFHHPSRAEKLP
jgi:hypothetical protein